LSPYEKDRIIDDDLGLTEMGRDMLSQDYILKQITASLIYPENETGKVFWAKVYEQAYELYGTTDIPVDTFNKVWIMPDEAEIYENGTNAFVTKATMKVMLDSDYLIMTDVGVGAASGRPPEVQEGRPEVAPTPMRELAKDILRNVVVPLLEKEVNEGQNFSQLRQIYYSLILAKWYKETLKDSMLNRKYSDQKKVNGVDLEDRAVKQKIYAQYLQAFEKGVFSFIKEERDVNSSELIPRKYFSGGVDWADKIKMVKLAKREFLARYKGAAGSLLMTGNALQVDAVFDDVKAGRLQPVERRNKPTVQELKYTKDRNFSNFLELLNTVGSELELGTWFKEDLLGIFREKGKDLVYVELGSGFGFALNEVREILVGEDEAAGKAASLFGIDLQDWANDPEAVAMALAPLEKMIKEGWPLDGQAQWEKFQKDSEYVRNLKEPQYELALGDITHVKFPARADRVVSSNVLQYLDDPLAAVENAFNQLARGGELKMHLPLPATMASAQETVDFYRMLADELQDHKVSFNVYVEEYHEGSIDIIFEAKRFHDEKISFNVNKADAKTWTIFKEDQTRIDMKFVEYAMKPEGEAVSVTDKAQTVPNVPELTPEAMASFVKAENRIPLAAHIKKKYGKNVRNYHGIKAVVDLEERSRAKPVIFFDKNFRHEEVSQEHFGKKTGRQIGYEFHIVNGKTVADIVMSSQLMYGQELTEAEIARANALILTAITMGNDVKSEQDIAYDAYIEKRHPGAGYRVYDLTQELFVEYYKDPRHQQELADFVTDFIDPMLHGDGKTFSYHAAYGFMEHLLRIALLDRPLELDKYLLAFKEGPEGFGPDVHFDRQALEDLADFLIDVVQDTSVLIHPNPRHGKPIWQKRKLKNGMAITDKQASMVRHDIGSDLMSWLIGGLDTVLGDPEAEFLLVENMHDFYKKANPSGTTDEAALTEKDVLQKFIAGPEAGKDVINLLYYDRIMADANRRLKEQGLELKVMRPADDAWLTVVIIKDDMIIGGMDALVRKDNVNFPIRSIYLYPNYQRRGMGQDVLVALNQAMVASGNGVVQMVGPFDVVRNKKTNPWGIEQARAMMEALVKKKQAKQTGPDTYDMLADHMQGGIDFDMARLDLQRKGQLAGLEWGSADGSLENLQISGLTPVIIQVTPIEDLPALLAASR